MSRANLERPGPTGAFGFYVRPMPFLSHAGNSTFQALTSGTPAQELFTVIFTFCQCTCKIL
jgi:hypothetical protein